MEKRKLYGFYSDRMDALHGHCVDLDGNGKSVIVTVVSSTCSTMEEFMAENKEYPKDAVFVSELSEFVSNLQHEYSSQHRPEMYVYRGGRFK